MAPSSQQVATVNSFTCDTCNTKFATEFALHIHKNTHFYNIPCKICNIIFTTTENLDNHIRNMHPECRNYYECIICAEKFTTRSELQTHAINHSGTIFECEYCDKIYLTFSSKRSHERSTHEESNFTCSICMVSFPTNSELHRHLTAH